MKIINKGNKKAEILIYEDIGGGWLGGVESKEIASQLSGFGVMDEINVRINSRGGSVFEGFAIYNALTRSGARIIVDIEALAASIASVVAMAGHEINIAANGMMMIHEAWGMFQGFSKDLRKQADLLDSVTKNITDAYADVSNLDRETIEGMMADEKWMNASQALEWGFVTNITSEVQMAAHHDLSLFQHPPQTMQAAAEVVKQEPTDSAARSALDYMSARTHSLKQ